ncbi:hypothetical protein [Rhodoferax sp.]|uniref:hypothetical protein n=1 Tax=Rhodoferax sp. TaxID=50421 RepID=UPI0025E4E2AA|nr:hypothetical protein [Rhodoferax sp.]
MTAFEQTKHLGERDGLRHNQIPIRLHLALGDAWLLLEAQQWNDRGFCFFHAQELLDGPIALKRSLQHFSGEIVWSRACQDKAQVMDMLLNEAIHQQAEKINTQAETRKRLLGLMRVPGMVEAKRRVLGALGNVRTSGQWESLLLQRMQEPLFQSGVRVESAAWNSVVTEALKLGVVVQDLERWSGVLGGR